MDGMGRCSVCGGEMLESPDGVCSECRARAPAALVDRRPPRPCARCGHPELIRSVIQDRWSTRSREHVNPLSVATDQADGSVIPAGILQVYVCRACGFAEWYASDPQAIPIGPTFGTELVRGEAGGPFR